MENLSNQKPIAHEITLTDRQKGLVTGALKVIAVNPSQITLETSLGALELTGRQLKIEGFNQSQHCFSFSGTVDVICYKKEKQPLIKRLFK